MGKQRYISPVAGGVYDSGYDSTRSGWPRIQFESKVSGLGRSLRLPAGAPPSTHLAIVSISLADSTRGWSKTPHPSTGFQGGICRDFVINLMASACAAPSP